MAKYRIVKVSEALYLVQRKRWLSEWKTMDDFYFYEYALKYFLKKVPGYDFTKEQIIVESD